MLGTSREIVIVGHGPSGIGRGLGKEIDKAKRIVRLKGTSEKLLVENPKDYGTRRDILCGSWSIRDNVHKLKAEEYWVFLDSRHKHVKHLEIQNELTRSMVVPQLCEQWREIYFKLRKEDWKRNVLQVSSQFSDSLGHQHMSAGMYAILYSCHLLKPHKISLVGFDNLMSAGFTATSQSRPTEWRTYPDHRWDTEYEMLPIIEEHFGVSICMI